MMTTEKYTVPGLLQQLMQSADFNYRAGVTSNGIGFVVHDQADSVKRACQIVTAATPVRTLPRLRRFASAVRLMMKNKDCTEAGVLCELDISLDSSPAEPMTVLYLDQRLAGMRVFVAPRRGDHLVFRDMGTAYPSSNFFPPLFTAETYGTPQADA